MIVVDSSFPGFVFPSFIIVNFQKKGYGRAKHYIFFWFSYMNTQGVHVWIGIWWNKWLSKYEIEKSKQK